MNAPARTLLLVSVAGSVRRHERLEDADAARTVERCLKRVERAVGAFHGRLLEVLGGEAMARFAHAEDALQAACEMQKTVAELAPQVGVRLALRIGVAHGACADTEGEGVCGGDAHHAAAHLAGQAQAGQVLLCQATRAALPEQWQARTREVDAVSLAGRVAAMRVFELLASAPAATSVAVFCLRYGDRVWCLDAPQASISIGRDAGSDVEVRDRRASRQHATIERRGDQVVLVDHSSNGSYVSIAGQGEVFVRAGEFPLRGAGTISFAASSSSPGADCARFEEQGGEQLGE